MPLLKLDAHEPNEESKIGNIMITVLPHLKGTTAVPESTVMVSSEKDPTNHEPITIVQH